MPSQKRLSHQESYDEKNVSAWRSAAISAGNGRAFDMLYAVSTNKITPKDEEGSRTTVADMKEVCRTLMMSFSALKVEDLHKIERGVCKYLPWEKEAAMMLDNTLRVIRNNLVLGNPGQSSYEDIPLQKLSISVISRGGFINISNLEPPMQEAEAGAARESSTWLSSTVFALKQRIAEMQGLGGTEDSKPAAEADATDPDPDPDPATAVRAPHKDFVDKKTGSPLRDETSGELKGIAQKDMRLEYGGVHLHDDGKALKDYNVEAGATIHVVYDHPMRGIRLGKVLEEELWRDADLYGTGAGRQGRRRSLMGRWRGGASDEEEQQREQSRERRRSVEMRRVEQRANWERSETVDLCSFFVSHAWMDEKSHPGKKVSMLRSFLCVQSLVARLLVAFGLVAVFLVPLGWAVAAITLEAAASGGGAARSLFRGHVFGWWWPSAIVLSALAVLLLWIALSLCGVVPSQRAPWALSSTTLWLDKCCVLQDTDETKASGVKSFKRFLGKCDCMIAFVSDSYFKRLWCVYELATFCRDHRASLDEKLVLLSLDWPSVFNPFKRAVPTQGELDWFRGFECAKQVECAKPSDRADVLAEIREVWRSEEEFDQFVREELPKIFEQSKTRYSRQLQRVMYNAFDIAFGG